jgi:hypothetical protein
MQLGQLKRREFITLLGGAAAPWPFAARAQQMPRRVGILMAFAASDPDIRARVAAFRQELGKLGWSEGNVQIDERWPSDDMDRVRADVAELLLFDVISLPCSNSSAPRWRGSKKNQSSHMSV